MSKDQEKEELFSVVEKSSENIENENLQKLKKVFPQFVKDGEIDFDAMQAFLKKDGVLAEGEKYGLNWSGKSNAFKAIRTPATGTLIPEKDKSKNWDETENIFIEGDNLEVLKLLQKHYREKVKMIYIDPPYNTGKDFVYKDNFTQGVSDYYEQTGQTKGGIKMTANTEKNGRYHSDWLTMMYPRLFLARNLLKEDGVIFVSIDDNEVANLRMVMDEIFGEENFLAQVVWERSFSPVNLKKYFSESHDYIICYAKSLDNIESITLSRTDEANDRYSNPDQDPRGVWTSGDFSVGPAIQTNTYEIVTPSGRVVVPPNGRSWRVSKDRFEELKKMNSVWFGENGDGVPRQKRFLNDVKKGITPMTLWKYVEVGHSQDATKKLKEIFDDRQFFDYPKPVGLIKKCVDLSTKENDIILDFFAGSGTTAHAVMELNSEDGGNRKYISVQLPETTPEDGDAYKAGYKTISEISRERIRRAGDKIGKCDIGFKSYRLANSNYRKWNEISDENTEELIKQSNLFIESPLVDDFISENVVYEIALKEGFNLSADLKQDKGNLKAYMLHDDERRLFVTFSDKVTKEKVLELKLSQDDVFVCLDSAMSDTEKVNVGKIINLKVI
ncbi:site-specific DNA-methyltransferase [Arenimonas sp.]|nr:site-specific DNA-methyltransferase [Candidatus Parcubacteria bacterium]